MELNLTDEQRKIYLAFLAHVQRETVPPTLVELCWAVGIPKRQKTRVRLRLEELAALGLLETSDKKTSHRWRLPRETLKQLLNEA